MFCAETVVELHHEVVEEAAAHTPRKPFRLLRAHPQLSDSCAAKKVPAGSRQPASKSVEVVSDIILRLSICFFSISEDFTAECDW